MAEFKLQSGRQSYMDFRGSKSKPLINKQGVPQRGVLSPLLFNLDVSKIPLPQSNIKLVTYADDTTILAKSNDIKTACDALNMFLPELHSFFTSRNLQISEVQVHGHRVHIVDEGSK